jgi:zinc protease
VQVAFHVPATAHDDLRALELLDLVLADGESSRLYRRLVDRDELALEVDTELAENFDPGLFKILVQNREGVEGPAVERALYDELQRVCSGGVTPSELRKAKNMRLTSFYRGIATLSGKAHELGIFELFHGGWRNLFAAADRYERLTEDDLRRVAVAYLKADNRTVVTLIPTAEPDQPAEAADAR